MRIRCDKCSTVYELDDGLLPPQGAPVQCSTCQFVFTAFPPRPARPQPVLEAPPAANSPQPEPEPEPEPVPVPPVERSAPAPAPAPASFEARPARPAPPVVGPARPRPERDVAERTGEITRGPLALDPAAESPPRQAARSGARPRAPGAPAPVEPRFTPDGRPIRKVPFPTDESSLTPVARPLQGKGAHPGAHPQGEKGQGQHAQGGMKMTPAPRRPIWAIVAAVVVVLGVVLLGWLLLSRRGETAREGVEGASEAPAPTGRAHGQGEPELALVPPAGARPRAP